MQLNDKYLVTFLILDATSPLSTGMSFYILFHTGNCPRDIKSKSINEEHELLLLRMGLNGTVNLIGHLDFSGLWLGMDLNTDTKKDMSLEEIALCAQNMLTILGSILNMIGGPI